MCLEPTVICPRCNDAVYYQDPSNPLPITCLCARSCRYLKGPTYPLRQDPEVVLLYPIRCAPCSNDYEYQWDKGLEAEIAIMKSKWANRRPSSAISAAEVTVRHEDAVLRRKYESTKRKIVKMWRDELWSAFDREQEGGVRNPEEIVLDYDGYTRRWRDIVSRAEDNLAHGRFW